MDYNKESTNWLKHEKRVANMYMTLLSFICDIWIKLPCYVIFFFKQISFILHIFHFSLQYWLRHKIQMKPSKLSMSCKLLSFFIVFFSFNSIIIDFIEFHRIRIFCKQISKREYFINIFQNTKKICNRSPEYNVIL